MDYVFIRLARRGSKTRNVVAPLSHINEIIEEYRLLGWKVSW